MTTARRLACCLAVLLLATPALAQQGLHWETNLDAARNLAAQTNRLVLVHFTAKWCGPCQKLEQQVFSQPGFGQALAGQYVAVKLDADAHQVLVAEWGVDKFPTDVILTPQGQLVHKLVSPTTAEQYVGAMQQVAAVYRQRSAPPPGLASPSHAAAPGGDAQTPSAAPRLSDDRYAEYFNSRPGPGAGAGVMPPAPPSPPMASPAPAAAPPEPSALGSSSPYGHLVGPSPPVPPTASPSPAQRPDSALYAGHEPRPAPGAQPPSAAPPSPPPAAPPVAGNPPAPSPPPATSSGNPPIGLDGYCPVTLVQRKQWTKGDARWGAIHRGRTYLFASPEAQQQFLASPDAYSPVMSGDDPVLALDQNQSIPGRRQHGVFYGGRVFLFSSEASLEVFSKNPGRYAAEVQQARR